MLIQGISLSGSEMYILDHTFTMIGIRRKQRMAAMDTDHLEAIFLAGCELVE
jgi:hypothetical protein